MRVIIAAAGTGGHINPGIAIANKIMQEEKNSEILFIGTSRGIEKDLVPRAGYKLETLEAYGLSKKISKDNIKKMIKTVKSIKVAEKIIKKFKPDIVIGTGGYICGPVITAANKLKIPTMLHESNSFPGLAVKMLSKKVDTIMLGFKEAKEFLPKAKNIVITGTPTKIKKLNLSIDDIKNIKKEMNLNENLPLILVFGGSQGAKKINDVITDIIIKKMNKNYQIIWAVGQKNYEDVKRVFKENKINIDNLQNAKVLPYIYDMEKVMNISDVIVCRSGAITITEICKIGKPAIFIPLPNVSQNHQEKNARVLQRVGAAYIILNNEITNEKLSDTINTIVKNKDKIKEMGENANKIAIDNVEDKIYREIKKLI